MPDNSPTPCRLDRILDPALRQLGDMDGVFFAYMDGGGSDIIGDVDSRKWYTTAVVASPNQSIELREKESDHPFFDGRLPLKKWACGPDSGVYRPALAEELLSAVESGRLIIRAGSYMHRTAQRAYSELVKEFYGGSPQIDQFLESIDHKGRQMITFPSLFDQKGKAISIQRKVWISLVMIAENISHLYKSLLLFSQQCGEAFNGLIVLSDKVSGDGRHGTPNLTVLNKMLEAWHHDDIRVSCYQGREQYCGEFIADNVAGLLNNNANNQNDPCRPWLKRLMRDDHLHWLHFGAVHRSKQMRLSGR